MDLEALRARLRTILDERKAAQGSLEQLSSTITAENRAYTEAEDAQFAAFKVTLRTADDDIEKLSEKIANEERDEVGRKNAERLAKALPNSKPVEQNAGGAKVGEEARTYRPDGTTSFIYDVIASTPGSGISDRRSAERIERHRLETEVELRGMVKAGRISEQRAITVSSMAGTVPPHYLVDKYAPFARAGKPFINALQVDQLPAEGISFVIPRGTTGATAGAVAEAAAFTDGSPAVTNDTVTVNLFTAKIDTSRTLVMRGGEIVDRILFPDMIGAYGVQVDTSALNGSGTPPQHLGVIQVSGFNAVTYTDASPTVPEIWTKVANAIGLVNNTRFMPANLIVMTPLRWAWFLSATDTTGRPLLGNSEPPSIETMNAMGIGKAAGYGQVVGTLMGLPVVTDANIPQNIGSGTNQDVILVVNTLDFLFWEDDIMTFTFEQTLTTAPGQIRLAVGGFSLAEFGRYPASISQINGTGLVTPAF